MNHVAQLMAAGVILGTNPPNQADTDFINNNLSDDEVNALISVYGKLQQAFVQRNFSVNSNAPAPGTRVIGIVF